MDAEVSQKKTRSAAFDNLYFTKFSNLFDNMGFTKFKILVFFYIPSLTDESVGFVRKNFFVFPGYNIYLE